MLNAGKLDQRSHTHLIGEHEKVKESPPESKSVKDTTERFSVFRSLRRGSDTRAINMKASANDIDVVNRWKRKEDARRRTVEISMRKYHAEVSFLVETFLRYKKAM